MLQVGITGGIGSGKTTVCKIFEILGIPVYYADERAKWLMTNDLNIIKDIKNEFGATAYNEKGELNRQYIAEIAFHNPEKLQALNALVHPAVFEDGRNWHRTQQNVPYTLKEAALLFESGSYKELDKIIVVTAPLDVRIQRVMERDQISQEAVQARISKQMLEEEKINQADYLIVNDGEQTLIAQVLIIHKSLMQ